MYEILIRIIGGGGGGLKGKIIRDLFHIIN